MECITIWKIDFQQSLFFPFVWTVKHHCYVPKFQEKVIAIEKSKFVGFFLE